MVIQDGFGLVRILLCFLIKPILNRINFRNGGWLQLWIIILNSVLCFILMNKVRKLPPFFPISLNLQMIKISQSPNFDWHIVHVWILIKTARLLKLIQSGIVIRKFRSGAHSPLGFNFGKVCNLEFSWLLINYLQFLFRLKVKGKKVFLKFNLVIGFKLGLDNIFFYWFLLFCF